MKILKGFLAAAALLFTLAANAQQPQVFKNDDRFFKEGLELYERQLYGPAQLAFSRYLALKNTDMRSVDAQYYYAISGLHLFHPNAEMLVRDFVLEHPDHPKAPLANFELGNFYFNKKDYERAVDFYKDVPGDRLEYETLKEAEFKRAYSHFAIKQFNEALTLFNRNKQGNHRYTFASNYYAGYLNFRNGNYTEAKEDLRTAEKNDAYRLVVPSMLTEILYKEGNIDEVISYGEQTLSRKPLPQNADDIRTMVGEAYYLKSDFTRAAEFFGAAVGKNTRTTDKGILYKLAFSEFKAGKNEEAIAHLKLLASQKDSLGQNAAYHLGLAYLKAKNKQFAATAFDVARRQNFDMAVTENARFKYAQIQYEQGNSREVINALASFRKDFPQSRLHDDADDLLSEAYLNSNNYMEAIRHIEKLSAKSDRIRRTYQRVTYYQGVINFNDGKFPDAVEMFDKSLSNPYVDSLVYASHFWKGEAYSIGQKWNEATNSYAAVFRSPGAQRSTYYDRTRYGIGYAYYNDKEYRNAQTHFRAFVNNNSNQQRKPYYVDAQLRLADTYYVTKDYKEAINYYNQVIAQNSPDSDYALFQKSVILSFTGEREQAKQNLEQLVTRYPKSRFLDEARFQRAQIDFESGNYAPAIAGFSTLIDGKNTGRLTPLALQKRGLAYMNLKKNNEAVADFKQVIDQYPSHRVSASAIFSLQEGLIALNRGDEFDKYLERFKEINPGNNAIESIEFETAKNLYFTEKYPQAITRLEAYLKAHPNTKYAMDARYLLGDSYYRTGNKQKAVQWLKEVVTENRSEYVNRAIYRIAELEFEAKNYQEALKFYSRLSNQSTSKKELGNAWIGIVRSNFALGDYAATKQAANALINQGNASLNATNIALLYRAKATYAMGNQNEALKELATTLNSASDENGAEAQYLIAEILYKQGKHKEALDAAYKLNNTFANYEIWLGRSFLLIADIFIATNENFQARATLNSLIENAPQKEIVDQAKAKLAALDNPNKQTGNSGSQQQENNRRNNRNVTQPDTIR